MTTLLALLLSLPARAADLEWRISAATAAYVGAETSVEYRIATPAGSHLEPDALASSTTDFVVVRAKFDADASAWAWTLLPIGEGRLVFRAHWSFDGKPLEAPPVEMAVSTPDIPKGERPRDIKPPQEARPALWPYLLAALLALGAWLAWRRWGRRAAARVGFEIPAPPPLPPEERARRDLRDLLASGLWERGEHAVFYLRLTNLLREYLESRFAEPATAMTSGEVARMVRSREPALTVSTTVREVLVRADLVKFARLTPAADDGPRDAGLISTVIDATTPSPPTVSQEGVQA